MEFPTVVRIKRSGGQVVQWWCDCYIGRKCTTGSWNLECSKWYNPFKIGKDGTREQVVTKYYFHVRNSYLYNDLHELSGKRLGCWCDIKPRTWQEIFNSPECHGQVLQRLFYEKFYL